MNNHEEKQVGAKTGDEEKPHELPSKHIENTDALLGDVHPTDRDQNSQEEANAKKENGT